MTWWQELLGQITFGALIIGAVALLARKALDVYSSKLLTNHQSRLDEQVQQKLEELRAESRIRAFVHESRTSRLDEKRLEIALGISSRLPAARVALERHMGPFQQMPLNETERREEKRQREVAAANKLNEFIDYFYSNDLVFPEDVIADLEELMRKLREAFTIYGSWQYDELSSLDAEARKERRQQISECWDVVTKTLPDIRNELRRKFRIMISPPERRDSADVG